MHASQRRSITLVWAAVVLTSCGPDVAQADGATHVATIAIPEGSIAWEVMFAPPNRPGLYQTGGTASSDAVLLELLTSEGTEHTLMARLSDGAATTQLPGWNWVVAPDLRAAARDNGDGGCELWRVGTEPGLVAVVSGSDPWFNPDSVTLATAQPDQVLLWRADSGVSLGACRGELRGFLGNGHSLVTVAKDGDTQHSVTIVTEVNTALSSRMLRGEAELGLLRDGVLLTSDPVADSYVTLAWHLPDLSPCGEFAGAPLGLSRDASRLATYSDEGVVLWALASGKQTAVLRGAGTRVAFTPDGRYLCSVLEDGNPEVPQSMPWARRATQLWDLATGRLVAKLPGGLVGVSPDGTRLVTMREVQLEPFVLGSTSLWSMPGGKLVADLGGWFKHFGNAGSRVTTNEAIWDARTGLRVADAPFSAVWSPDGTHFVTQHDPPGQVWRLD